MVAAALTWMIAVAAVIGNTRSLPGFDAYYNVALARIMAEEGWVLGSFPWTTCSIWTEAYFDKEWLFHVYLMPFVVLFGEIQGAKIATMTAVFLVGLSWGFLLRTLGVRRHLYAAMVSVLFATGYLFLCRLVLCRSVLFSLVFLPLCLAFMISRRRLPLFVATYLYMLSHAGAWHILLAAMLFDCCDLIKKESDARNGKIMFNVVLLGVLSGLIINPYFPRIIYGVFLQTALVLRAKWFGVSGGEIFQAMEFAPIAPRRILWHMPLFIAFVYSAWRMFKGRFIEELAGARGFLFLLSGMYVVLTIISQRFIEYSAPLAAVYVVFCLSSDLGSFFPIKLSPPAGWRKALPAVIASVSLVCGAYSVWILNRDFHSDHLEFEDSTRWLRENVEEGEIIFHADWDIGAILFCLAPEFRYLVVLEPYFMYAYSPEMYFLWERISSGKISTPSVPIVAEFNSRVVFVPNDRPALRARLLKDSFAHLQYEGLSGESVFLLDVPEEVLLYDKFLRQNIRKKTFQH